MSSAPRCALDDYSVFFSIGNGLVTDSMLERYGCNVLGVDVNLSALQHVSWSKRSQPASADLLRSDLVSWARSTRGGMFDIVVFNPPYVPTDADELARARVSHDISASWAGGHRGREIIDDALRSVRRVLVHGGLFYLVVENRNDVQDVLRLARTCGFQDGDIVLKRRAGPETLYVLRFRNG